jgi:hypothetical protein
LYLAISTDGVELRMPERLTDLYASYRQRLTSDKIAEILTEHDAGELSEKADHVVVPVDTLRRLAAGRVPEGWEADFEGMLADAHTKGRLTDDGSAISAPLEREM